MPLFSTPDDEDDPQESGITSSQFAQSVRAGLDRPQLDVTQGALPLPSVPSGDGSATAGAPKPPEAPDFPEMDVPTGAPERDTEARRTNKLQALLGTLGTAVAAAGDDPMMLNVASGLAQGGAQDLKRRKKNFAKRQQAFQEAVTQAQKFNRRMRQKETQAEYERALSAFEQRQQDRRQRAEATNQRVRLEDELQAERRQNQREHERTMKQIQARARQRRKTERRQNQREHERTMKQIQARGRQRRKTQRVENQTGGSQEGPGAFDMEQLEVPSDPQETQRRLDAVNTRLNVMRGNRADFERQEFVPGQGVTTVLDEEYKERLSQLEQYRQTLRNNLQQSTPQQNGQQGAGATGESPAPMAATIDNSAQQRAINPGDPGFGDQAPRDSTQQTRSAPAPSRDTTARNTTTRDTTARNGAPRDTTTRDTTTRNRSQQQGRAQGYVQELNQTLQSKGRRATLMKIADDLENGRITERQASAYYEQIAPDSLLNR